MGLNTTHGCWDGGYTSFGHFRRALALAAGIDLDSMEGFGGSIAWDTLKPDPIITLLDHADNEGEIAVVDLLPLAERLEELLPLIRWSPLNFRGSAMRFARGCRRAAEANEPVEFH